MTIFFIKYKSQKIGKITYINSVKSQNGSLKKGKKYQINSNGCSQVLACNFPKVRATSSIVGEKTSLLFCEAKQLHKATCFVNFLWAPLSLQSFTLKIVYGDDMWDLQKLQVVVVFQWKRLQLRNVVVWKYKVTHKATSSCNLPLWMLLSNESVVE